MRPDLPLFLFAVLLGLVGVVAMVEHGLYGGWNRQYYTRGLAFIVLRVEAAAPGPDIPTAALLEDEFRSARIGSLVFEPLAPNIYGFRRRFFQSAWIPNNLMHGMLCFDHAHGCVVAKGYVNAWTALLALVLVIFCVLAPFPGLTRLLPLGFTMLVFGILLLMEQQRCARLARFAAQAWNAGSRGGAAR